MRQVVGRSFTALRFLDKCRHESTSVLRHQHRRHFSRSVESETDFSLERGLYIVSTPIGNLEDITFRAVRILKHVSCVYAEDTRRTLKLFSSLDISTPLISCHAHNEVERAKQIIQKVTNGQVRLSQPRQPSASVT